MHYLNNYFSWKLMIYIFVCLINCHALIVWVGDHNPSGPFLGKCLL